MPFQFTFDGSSRCLVPAIEVRRFRGRLTALHSMPFGTYGGILGCADLERSGVEAIMRFLLENGRRRFHATVYPNPLAPPLPPSLSTHVGHVHVVDLQRGWESWHHRLDEKVRYGIRKAQRRGVEVRSRLDAPTLEAFYNHYARLSKSRFMPSLFGTRFFQAIWQNRSPRIQLWTAYKDKRMLAGTLLFQYRGQATVFLSFVLPDGRPLAAKTMIYDRLIHHGTDAGWSWLNLLGSGGHPGVESFKQSLGGSKREFVYFDLPSPIYRLLRRPIRWARGRRRRWSHGVSPRITSEWC